MVEANEAAETLSRCPRCQDDLGKTPDKHCPLCQGSGLVTGAKAMTWSQKAQRASAPPTE